MLEGRTCYVGLLMDLPTSSLYSPVPQHTYFFFLGLHEYKIVQISGSKGNVSGEGDTASTFCSDSFFLVPIWRSWVLLQPESSGSWQPERMSTTNACCPPRGQQLSLSHCYTCVRAVRWAYCALLTDLWPAGLAGDAGGDNGTTLLLELQRAA